VEGCKQNKGREERAVMSSEGKREYGRSLAEKKKEVCFRTSGRKVHCERGMGNGKREMQGLNLGGAFIMQSLV